MGCHIKHRFFLLRKDFADCFCANRKRILLCFLFLAIGVGIGIYVGIGIGGTDTPFGCFAALFHLQYRPFSYITPEILRFVFFAILTALSFLLPAPFLYPAIALIFFGKYYGQLACVVFQSDSFVAFLLSAVLIYLPSLLIGGALLCRLYLRSEGFRIACGADVCPTTIKEEFFSLLKTILCHFLCLVVIHLLICGAIYLVAISL